MSEMRAGDTTHFAGLTEDGSLMAVGVEAGGVRACLLESVSGRYRLVGWIALRRTPGASISQSISTAVRRLGSRLGRNLWDDLRDGPLLTSDDAVRVPPLTHFLVGASPRPLLRVWLTGLSQSVSLAAARRAVAGAPVQIVGETALVAGANGDKLAKDFAHQRPEVVIVAGGYDSHEPAAQMPLLDLLAHVGNAVNHLPDTDRPTLIFAGNRWVGEQAQIWLPGVAGSAPLHVLENILPRPDRVYIDELVHTLRREYQRVCGRASGYSRVESWATNEQPIEGLESAFARLVQVWMGEQSLPELHGVYCTSDWWLHVLAQAGEKNLRLQVTKAGRSFAEAADWPPVQMVSGEWPDALWPVPPVAWWDRASLAPLLGLIGQVDPVAMLQALSLDLLERPPRQESAA